MHISRGRRHFFIKKTLFCFCFTLYLFSYFALWCFELYLVSIFCCSHASCLCVGHAYIFMLFCFIGCMFRWSFSLLYDHCSHFHMTVICLINLLICFTSCLLYHIFTCYTILVILLLALSWGSNAFCASVSRYGYCVPSSL